MPSPPRPRWCICSRLPWATSSAWRCPRAPSTSSRASHSWRSGFWTLRGDELSEDEESKAGRTARSAFFVVAVAFFLAELGDKTMLATVTLATTEGWFGTWIGSTLGMVAADALAIGVGALLGKALPEKVIKIGASILFFAFGAWLIYEGITA